MIWLVEHDKSCQSFESIKGITKWNDRNVLWIWMQRNVFFTSGKNQFLEVKSYFKPGRIATHENLDVKKMTIWKQTARFEKCPKTEPESKLI